ncbi:MAG: hypothetical protein J0G29_07800 [Alphaproteobacteria bacterium]|nr:hypothetical protein [Alphaproteobacteria bacterium]
MTCAFATSTATAATELAQVGDFSLHQVSHNGRTNAQILELIKHLAAPSTGKLRQSVNATDPVTSAGAGQFIAASEATVPEAARAGVIWVAPAALTYFRYPLVTNPSSTFAVTEWSIKQQLQSCLIGTIIQPTDSDFFANDNIGPAWVVGTTTNDQFNTLLNSINSGATKPVTSFTETTLPVLAGGYAVRIIVPDASITNKRYVLTCYFKDKS